jgi:2-polyprenyl-3-methyl-5-hydroxy-6-metoxy-1,4-benzoquinol methylase
MTFIERVVPGESSSRGELAAHVQRYKFAAPLVQAKRVLDAGCGSGHGAKLLRDAGASGVVAVDISHEAIEIARKRYSADGVQFLQDDCQSLSQISGRFDVIIAFESIEHFEHVRKFLERVHSLLAPGGICYWEYPKWKSPRQR